MRKSIALAFVIVLGACTSPGSSTDPAGTGVGLNTLTSAAFAARTAYAVALVAANQYASLPRCERPSAPPLCSKQNVVDIMRQADVAADNSTLAAERAVREFPSSQLTVAIVQAAKTSVAAFATVAATKGGA
jgi:hypothetical protein